MLMVLLAVGVATVLALGFLASQSTAMGVGRNLEYQDRARNVAETGLQLAVAKVKADPSWRTNLTNGVWASNISYAGGTFTVRGEDGTYNATTNAVVGDADLGDDATDPCTITCVGRYGGVSHTARALLTTTAASTPTVLMIVVDADSLSATEATRKTMIEGWGWTVTLLDQGSSQSELDDAADEADIIYVPSTMNSSTMASKLASIDMGIVIESSAYNNKFGVSSGSGGATSGTQINITNNSHYITETMSAAPLTIFTSSQSIPMVTGSSAAGMIQLGRRVMFGTQTMLAILEANAVLQGGGTAPARRAFMPWGASSFDPNALNANGRTLLQRSLDWVAGRDQSGATSTTRIGLAGAIALQGNAKIDSFDSDLGAYSAGNQGSDALVSTNTTLPHGLTLASGTIIKGDAEIGPGGILAVVISLQGSGTITGSKTALDTAVVIPNASTPSNLGWSVGDRTYSSGTTVINSSFRMRNLTIRNSATLQISGNVVLRIDRDFNMQDSSRIQLLPNSTLVIYARRQMILQDNAEINVNTAQPANAVIYAVGSSQTEFKDNSQVYATLLAPSRDTKLDGSAHVHGSLLGNTLTMQGSSIFSMDATATVVPVAAGAATYSVNATWIENP